MFPPSTRAQAIACAVQIVKKLAVQLLELKEFQEIRQKLPTKSQGGAYKWQTILVLIILVPVLGERSMRNFLKKLTGDQSLQAAFGLLYAPSPSTVSRYKNQIFGEQTIELMSLLFLIELHYHGVLDLNDLVADGSPVKAHLNPKRFRALEDLPYELIQQLFQAQNLTKIEKLLHRGPREKYTTADYIKILQAGDFLGFYGTGAFYRFLRVDSKLQEALGLTNGVPSESCLRNFKSRSNRQLWAPFVEEFPTLDIYGVLDILAQQLTKNRTIPPNLITTNVTRHYDLFNLFKTRPHVIDPTARFGYTVSKREIFIGYRWLIIGTYKKCIPLTHCLGQPTQGEEYLLLQALKKLHHIFQQLDQVKRRRIGRIYIDGGLSDSKHAPYYELLRLNPCVTKHRNLKSLTPRWTTKRVESEHLIARLMEFGGMRNHRGHHIKHIQFQGTIAIAALQLNALCALELKLPEFMVSPTEVFS